MNFINTMENCMKLAELAAAIERVAEELHDPRTSIDDAFREMWNLAFVRLRDLEDMRNP